MTQPLLVPAQSEIVLEGRILPDQTVREGPFGEFVGYLSPPGEAPVVEITAVTHRARPIYHAINGYGRETVMLRKYVLEASLLKVLQAGGADRGRCGDDGRRTSSFPRRRPGAQRLANSTRACSATRSWPPSARSRTWIW